MLSLDRLRSLHPRDPPWRTRARRSLVVGGRRCKGMRASRGRVRQAGAERGGMSEFARIAPIASLPLFHALEGRKAAVVGSSTGANWKAELLEAAGANVIRLGENWKEADLEGAAIAVADLANREDVVRFSEAAR